jgi:hypothetical protein
VFAATLPSYVYAAQPVPRSLTISNSFSGAANVEYKLNFSVVTLGLVGSVALQLCDNTALVDETCNAPAGFDASGVTLDSQAGMTGFSVSGLSDANTIILARPPGLETSINATFELGNIINPANGGPLYARVLTYPTSDATGLYTDAGGMALYIIDSLSLNAEVPPYLLFCVGESITNFDCNTATEAFSDLGILSPTTTGAAQHQMVAATNADSGYSVSVLGTSMTSGNNVLTAMAGQASQKGVPQFGLNLRDNTSPIVGQSPAGPGIGTVAANYNQQNIFRFNNGDTIASAIDPDDFRKYTVSYVVNIAPNQPGGVYSTTLTYNCLANF